MQPNACLSKCKLAAAQAHLFMCHPRLLSSDNGGSDKDGVALEASPLLLSDPLEKVYQPLGQGTPHPPHSWEMLYLPTVFLHASLLVPADSIPQSIAHLPKARLSSPADAATLLLNSAPCLQCFPQLEPFPTPTTSAALTHPKFSCLGLSWCF